jgi:hypothetical protein
MVVWIQSSPDSRPKTANDWRELLFLRLTNQHERIEPEGSTRDAERILRIGGNSYYYVNALDEAFGNIHICYERNDNSDCSAVMVTPFDTGGMALGKIKTDPILTKGERRDLVEKHSHDIDAYVAPFAEWVDDAFDESAAYVTGERPGWNSVEEIINTDVNTRRSWMWEGRVKVQKRAEPVLNPVMGYAHPERIDLFLEYVLETRPLAEEDVNDFLAMTEQLFTDSERPGSDTRDYLLRGGTT